MAFWIPLERLSKTGESVSYRFEQAGRVGVARIDTTTGRVDVDNLEAFSSSVTDRLDVKLRQFWRSGIYPSHSAWCS